MESVKVLSAGQGKQFQTLSPQDRNLVTISTINTAFGQQGDYIELHIYNELGEILLNDYDATDYYPSLNNPKNNTYSNIVLDPEKDIRNRGFNRGNLNIQYGFYKRLFNSGFGTLYWIKEVSFTRTELKLASQVLSDASIRSSFSAYQNYITSKNYYPIFYLNFGNNQTVIATNAAYTQDDEGAYILVKLYEPLPSNFDVKSQLWIVDKIADSVSFDVSIEVFAEEVADPNALRGPNYNVRLNTKTGQTTPYYNYNNLVLSPVSSSYQKMKSFYQDKAVELNIDYSDFKNFVHFSSAVQRVNNFVYKLQLIESASAVIGSQMALVGGGSVASSSISVEQKFIDNTIKNFDIYEYFLYFESSSFAWPKSNSTQPYNLYSVTSSEAKNFLGSETTIPTAATASLLFSASYYDSTNKDTLHQSIPQYILDDPANQPFITFLDMIGQHFDNIWVYYKDVSNRFDATNNPKTGISLDLVSDALRGLGMQLYTNTNVSDNLYYTMFGINPDGSLLPPTGSEWITNYVTSSLSTLPAEQLQDEVYKRLYHNLPYLFKTKGTARGIKSIVSSYGIPESMLKVREFGGNAYDQLNGVLDIDTSEYKITIDTGSWDNPQFVMSEVLEYITAEDSDFMVTDVPMSVTGSLTISSSLLSPYTTLQYYVGNRRLNSTNLEIGFSPSDTINEEINANQGIFVIDQLIGSPSYRYSSSYEPLVSASNAYFSSYTQPNSVWEYVRLLKFYNNSLFKVIKDFVPARANVSTGIIIKSHLYERNKYARHEPSMSILILSQSIDMISISGSSGGSISGDTDSSGYVMTIDGPAFFSRTDDIEKYNGELSGSYLTVTSGKPFPQTEVSQRPAPFTYSQLIVSESGQDYIASEVPDIFETENQIGNPFYVFPIYALYQNVTASVRSEVLLDLDYNGNQLKPINYNIVTQSINQYTSNNYATYANPNNPYAQVQDYNYNLRRSLIPRYIGSQTVSSTYNTYTPGDQSYGKTAAIDKIKYQYGYLVDIYSASAFLPNRSNAQIKYIIDNDQNVLDLTKTNKNIFDVQNIYKSGESADISLFDYDETNPYTQQLANNPTIAIYEGGWRYLPILHNVSKSLAGQKQEFTLNSPLAINIEVGSSFPPTSEYLQPYNYVVNFEQCDYYDYSGPETTVTSQWYASVTCSLGNVPSDVTLTFNYTSPANCGLSCGYSVYSISTTINSGNESANIGYIASVGPCVSAGGYDSCYASSYPCDFTVASITGGSGGGGAGTKSIYTYYTSTVTSSQACLYYLSQSNEIVFSPELTYYYVNNSPLIFSSSSDIDWAGSGLSPVILPFNLSPGDKISLYDSSSRLGWNELNEYSVKSVRISGSSSNVTGSVLLAEMSQKVNLALFTSGSTTPTESITNSPFRSCRYIVWKHVPDETNVMLRFNPKDSTIVENGLLFPQYIDKNVRDNSGNVIKALKQQNLI